MIACVRKFEGGKIHSANREVCVADIGWAPHTSFQGVYLKHLVTAAETEGRFSTHLVRIAAGHEIGEHTHATQYELHEVLDGTGICHMGGSDIAYLPGVCAVITEGVPHKVVADDQDLYLFAKFVPALL